MVSFNVKEVLQQAGQEKEKALPEVIIHTPAEDSRKRKENGAAGRQISLQEQLLKDAAIQEIQDGVKSDLTNQCWKEYHAKKLERKKLSTEIFRMVESGATRSELKEHYHKIITFQSEEKQLFDRARFAEQHGHLPEPEPESIDLLTLKDQRRKLVDLRCKLQKKLEVRRAKNPNRVIEWQLELDRAHAEYILINDKLGKLTGKA